MHRVHAFVVDGRLVSQCAGKGVVCSSPASHWHAHKQIANIVQHNLEIVYSADGEDSLPLKGSSLLQPPLWLTVLPSIGQGSCYTFCIIAIGWHFLTSFMKFVELFIYCSNVIFIVYLHT